MLFSYSAHPASPFLLSYPRTRDSELTDARVWDGEVLCRLNCLLHPKGIQGRASFVPRKKEGPGSRTVSQMTTPTKRHLGLVVLLYLLARSATVKFPGAADGRNGTNPPDKLRYEDASRLSIRMNA